MKFLSLLLASLLAALPTFAQEVFGIVTPAKGSLYFADRGHAKAVEIDSVDIAQFSHFDIQRDAAVLYSRMGTVRIYDHLGKVILPETAGTKAKISSSLIALTNAAKMVTVYSKKSGKLIYTSTFPATVGVSDWGFVVRNLWNQRWEIYSPDGTKISDNWVTLNAKMWMNEAGVITLEDQLLRLWDQRGNLVSAYPQAHSISINDELVTFQQNFQQMTIASFDGSDQVYLQANLVAMLPGAYLLNQQNQNFLYDNKHQMKEALFNRSLAGGSNRFLLLSPFMRTGFELYDRTTGQYSIHMMSIGMALSDTAVASKTGPTQVEILSGDRLSTESIALDPNLKDYGISDQLYFYRSAIGAIRTGIVKTVDGDHEVFKDTLVESVSLANPSLRRNWGSF